jgi:hypothetical protein
LVFAGTLRTRRPYKSMSRGLGTLERAIIACIEKCRQPNYHADLYVQMGKEPPKPVVQVSAWGVWAQSHPPTATARAITSKCLAEGKRPPEAPRPTEAQLKAAKRAMRSFVRKFPAYGLMVPKGGRGRLLLYERGDEMSAMWAKLKSQSRKLVTHDDARAALKHLKARRNEPFALKGKRFIHYRGLSHGLTVKGKRVFRDIALPDA